MMKCTACKNELTEMTVGGIAVDICKGGCGGIWFDNYELSKFNESHEHHGEALLDIETNSRVKVDYAEKRQCPKCESISMMRRGDCLVNFVQFFVN